MSGPSLLSIPRELRDTIYKHLHHSILCRYVCNIRVSQLGMDRVPIVNVLLINRQVHDEYREMAMAAMSAIRDIEQERLFKNDEELEWTGDLLGFFGPTEELSANVASQVQNLVILSSTECYVDMDGRNKEVWSNAEKAAAESLQRYPQLATIQVVLRYEFGQASENDLLKLKWPYTDPTGRQPPWTTNARSAEKIESSIAQCPSNLAGLPLRHREHGHYVTSAMTPADYKYERVADEDNRDDFLDPMDSVMHILVKVISYVYTRSTSDRMLGFPELWSHWSENEYLDLWLEDFEEETVKRIQGRERKVLEWTRDQI